MNQVKGLIIIECKRKYFRPLEVDNLLGNSKKARKITYSSYPWRSIKNTKWNALKEKLVKSYPAIINEKIEDLGEIRNY